MPEVTIGVIIGMFIGGLIAIVLEMFVPGGVIGAFGGLIMIAAIVLGFSKSQTLGLILLGAGVVLVPAGIVGAMNLAPRLPFSKKLFLQETLSAEKGYISSEAGLTELIGKEGVAVSDLRPSGIAEIEKRRTDVITGGEMIEKGARIRVVEVGGNRVIVEEEIV